MLIGSDVTIASDTNNAVYSNVANSVLANGGNVIAPEGNGIYFDTAASDSSITNRVGAFISGPFGLFMAGSGNQIFTNFGSVIATAGGAVGFGSAAHVALSNHGYIGSPAFGIDDESLASDGTINNFHVIEGGGPLGVGIYLKTSHSSITLINNSSKATITASVDAIKVDAGCFTLHNSGRIIGDIVDNGPTGVRDVIINHGKILGSVDLGGGNDLFNGTGGKSGAIFGGDGNDRIIGGKGNDQILGGTGNNKLTGGPGADQFFFDTPATNVNTITDFKPAQHDKIVLSATYFNGLTSSGGTLDASNFHIGATALTPSQHILYTPGNGFLYYDLDGSGQVSGAAHFATIANHLALQLAHIHLTSADFLVEA